MSAHKLGSKYSGQIQLILIHRLYRKYMSLIHTYTECGVLISIKLIVGYLNLILIQGIQSPSINLNQMNLTIKRLSKTNYISNINHHQILFLLVYDNTQLIKLEFYI